VAVYSFGDVTVDEAAFRVRRGSEPVELEPKALEVLLVLLERRGQLVTKAELQAAVWPATAVTESTLTRVVAQLRKALDDDARDARYIETVPTRGYRFVAAVRAGEALTEASPEVARSEPPARPGSRARLVAAAGAVLGMAALAAWWIARDAPAAGSVARAGPPAVLLSTTPGINGFPSFSPDGASLAFASDRSGTFEIYVRGLDSSARDVGVTSDGQQNIQPAWSPDGRQIAYVSLGRGGIWVVPALGGAPRPLTAFGGRPAWSPDSATIVFQSQTPTHPLGYSAGSGSVLWSVAATGGEPRILTRRSGWGHGSPAFSPDGSRIAYSAGAAVRSVRPDGSDSRRLYRFDNDVDQVFYGRDGRELYVSFTPPVPADVGGRLVRLRLGSDGVVVGEPEQLAAGWASGRCQMALAPDGRKLAYVEAEAQHGVDVVALRGDGTAAGPPQPLLPQLTLRGMAPAFSTDGRRLALGVFRPGGGWSLWLADADGTRVEPARAAPIARSHFSWLRDGRVVVTEGLPGRRGMRLIAVDPASGREEVLLAADQAIWTAKVSADGRRVAFMRMASEDDVFQVWTASLPGGSPRPVTSDPEGVGWPAWSPDGSTLAVEALRRGDSVLAVMPADGGPLRPLASKPEHSWPGEFTPDGRNIVFAAQRSGAWNVCLVAVSGGPERCVTSNRRFDGYVRMPAMAPAGDRVVFERVRITARLWLGELP
jgi:Tol biopolymer transport system component/DNA-binding winged helix-turn-helix (wHTH) protein